MSHRRPFPQMLLLISTFFWIVPPAAYADRIGTPYRGPMELLGGSAKDTEEEPNVEEGATEEEGGEAPGETPGEDPGSSEPGAGPGTTAPGGGGKTAVFDGKIVWQWWWEFNKDRFLARATKRGRVNAGSAYYWFGSGAKYPPREIVGVAPTLKNTKIYKAIRGALEPTMDNAVRAEAAIALGRLGSVPVAEADRKENVPNDHVVRDLMALVKSQSDEDIRRSAILGLGISGNPEGMEALAKYYPHGSNDDKAHIAIAMGLARYEAGIKLLSDHLPKSANDRAAGPAQLGAIHGLGLMGPQSIRNESMPDAVKRLKKLAGRGRDDIVTQAVAALGRLQQELGTVRKAAKSKTKNVQWTAVLALANYSDNEKDATGAAKELIGKQGIKANEGQTKTFAILAAGDLAGRVDPNWSVRKKILLPALRDLLDKNRIYTCSAAAVALGLAVDSDARTRIAEILSESKDNTVVAGCCLGLGLLHATDQSKLIRNKVLLAKNFKPDTRGYAAMGIALMGDTTQIGDLRKVQSGTGLTMETLRQTPLALGVLGGKREVPTLVGHFSKGFKKHARYKASNAVAGLSWNRDVSAVDKLLKAYSGSADRNARGLTVIALGYVGAADQVNPLTRCYENMSFRKQFDWNILLAISAIL